MQTQGRVTQEDINRVFDTLKQLPNYNMGNGMMQLMLPIFFFCFFCCFFLFIYFFVIRLASAASDSGSPLLFPFILVGVIVVAMLIIFGVTFGINYYLRQKMNKRTEEIKKCLEDFNQKEFAAKEVAWKVGTLAAWIQLDLNYVFAQMNNLSSMGQPQMMMNLGFGGLHYQHPNQLPMAAKMDQSPIPLQNVHLGKEPKAYNPRFNN